MSLFKTVTCAEIWPVAGSVERTPVEKTIPLANAVLPVKAAPSETKLERKKTLVNVPSAAARQTPVEDEEAEETVEDAIQKMAKARGQSRAIVHGRVNSS